MRSILLGLVVAGCRVEKPSSEAPADSAEGCAAESCDEDGDGFRPADGDCDDGDAGVNPAGEEICDGRDQDCDGEIDEDVLTTFYEDADQDGFGNAEEASEECEVPAGYVTNGTDCDDAEASAWPGAEETCDGVDNDCDGLVDDGVSTPFYADADGDGWGDPDASVDACDLPEGYVEDDTDCDDTTDVSFPGNPEVCDERDNDCDGTVDEGVATTWFADFDGDEFGDPALPQEACALPTGYSAHDTDCDDADAAIHPDASEVCNGVDDDCDGDTDEGSGSTWYADADGDGFGDAASSADDCAQPAGYVADASDCDDARAASWPGAVEYCNGHDDDCDGTIDEDDALDALDWYADADSDAYGDVALATTSCSAPSGYVADASDCDDARALTNPAATETCNSIDDDCDGTVDDGASGSTWYPDDDGDGYGGAAESGCTAPSSTPANDWDCDDADASVYPGASSSCPWPSCLDLLNDGIASTSGDYWIDFDGVATETECDMDHDGGGWTLIFEDDMDSPDGGWSTTSTYSCGAWGTILGGYGVISGGTMDIDLDTYAIVHTEAWVELDYLALDSWDGETAYVQLAGATIWSQAQNNHDSSYSEVCGWNRGYNGSYDSSWPVSAETPDTAATVNLLAGSTLDQGSTDESFGIDDVFVWIR